MRHLLFSSLLLSVACGGPATTEALSGSADAAATTDAQPAAERDATPPPDAGVRDALAHDASPEDPRVDGPCALDPTLPPPAPLAPRPRFPALWKDDVDLFLHTYDPASMGTIFTADSMQIVVWSGPSFTMKASLGSCALIIGNPVGGPTRAVGDAKEQGLTFDLTQFQHPGFRFLPGAVYVLEVSDNGTTLARLVWRVPRLPFTTATVTRSSIAWTPFPDANGLAWGLTVAGTTMSGFAPSQTFPSLQGTASWNVTDPTRTHARVRWDVDQAIGGMTLPAGRTAEWMFPL
jgi:hypothetical protein